MFLLWVSESRIRSTTGVILVDVMKSSHKYSFILDLKTMKLYPCTDCLLSGWSCLLDVSWVAFGINIGWTCCLSRKMEEEVSKVGHISISWFFVQLQSWRGYERSRFHQKKSQKVAHRKNKRYFKSWMNLVPTIFCLASKLKALKTVWNEKTFDIFFSKSSHLKLLSIIRSFNFDVGKKIIGIKFL